MNTPPTLTLYRALWPTLKPFSHVWLKSRAKKGKEDGARLRERYGQATQVRPVGTLVWLHGASMGETRVLLNVRNGLAAARPDLHFLITTGTRTAADLVAADAHPRTRHQFAVLDFESSVRRFLDHWRPNLGIFAESEVWPNMMLEAARRNLPVALINACMGDDSISSWSRFPESAQRIFSSFALIVAADQPTAKGLEKLTGRPVLAPGNLKLSGALAAPNAQELETWRTMLAGRKVWVAASTHEGEDEIAIEAHAKLRATHPDALLIIAPRHPLRGAAIAALADCAPRRSLKQYPNADAPVFVADTLRELGLFFALAPVAFMGGSLLPPLEGHNPVEPTVVGAAVIAGPYVSSFAEIYVALDKAGGLAHAGDATTLAARVDALWRDEAGRTAQVNAAQKVLHETSPALASTITSLLSLLTQQDQHAPA